MKSFYDVLSSRLEFGEQIENTRKPILRSSGIFPAIKNKFYSTQILFLGYWKIKRNINEISCLVTLRDKSGKILKRDFMSISEPRSYVIELDYMLKNILNSDDFIGSLEVEFFSTRDMVFPFPALVLNYFNKEFNTCVHTLGRIYNDFEDLNDNEKSIVPETGFDIYSDSDLTSFFAFVNGTNVNDNGIIDYTITNHQSKNFSGTFSIGKINPFETMFIKLSNYIPELTNILGGHSGSISLKHNFSGFFPRFLVGNIQTSFPSISFTHSYYDCKLSDTPSDYWNRINENYDDSSIYIPLFLDNDNYTDLIFYPNFSPSLLNLDIKLYDKQGILLHDFSNVENIDSTDSKLLKINFNDLVRDLTLDKSNIHTAHIIANSKESKIPSRIKCGLNVGIIGKESKLPSNICFNLHPGNPLTEDKPGSFHWLPLFHSGKSIMSIANFSPLKKYSRSAQIALNFYHEENSQTIERNIEIPAYNEYRLNLEDDSEIKSFIKNSHGWVTIKANNPHIQGYYFNFHPSGSVAGDHVF